MIVQSSQVALAETIEVEAVEVAESQEVVEVIVTIGETVTEIGIEIVVVEIEAEAERGDDLATGDLTFYIHLISNFLPDAEIASWLGKKKEPTISTFIA